MAFGTSSPPSRFPPPCSTEGLGTYGGPTTLPCGHNGCVHCMVYLQQRSPQCPLCRADFPPDVALKVNHDLKEMLRLAQVRCVPP